MNKGADNASIPRDEPGEDIGGTGRDRGGEDRDLVERAQAGDPEAFRVLFDRYHRRAYAVAVGVVRNRDDALDIVQESFVKAHRSLPRFAGSSSFYTWFYRIVMNLCIDHVRRQRRVRQVSFEEAADSADAAAAQEELLPRILGQHPGRALVRKRFRAQVAAAMDALSENHRAVLIMREFEGMSYQEMADVMGCSKGTIMSRLFHARRNVQQKLIEFLDGETNLEG